MAKIADQLMTALEVAEYLEIPIATLYGWRTKGDGPTAIKVGRHLRYRSSDVERWLETRSR